MAKEEQAVDELIGEVGEKYDQVLATYDELAGQTSEHEKRIRTLEDQVKVLKDMMREEARVEADFQPIARDAYPADILADVGKGLQEWHRVVPLRNYTISRNGFAVPFRRGVEMEIPTGYYEDAKGREPPLI